MNPEDISAGKFYKLKEPTWSKTIGQGDKPKALIYSLPGKTYCLPWGTVFKASDTCDKEFGVANLEASPYPLIRTGFIKEHINQFEEIISE